MNYSTVRMCRAYEIDEILDKKVIHGRSRYLIRKLFSDTLTWELTENVEFCEKVAEFEKIRRKKLLTNQAAGDGSIADTTLEGDKTHERILHKLVDAIKISHQCSICLDTLVEATLTACDHVFCYVCVKRWKRLNSNCPMCRSKLTLLHKLPIINKFISKTSNAIPRYMRSENMTLSAQRNWYYVPRISRT